jgi:DNA polymerase
MDLLDKDEQLNELKKQIISDGVCPNLAVQAKQLVFGVGNSNSKLVFIGEAPGKKEDEAGIPFVGAAGRFLDEMLSSINIAREDIYITNIVKYRPPENRDPLPVEKQAFLPYLQRELQIIHPQLVVTLGRHAANCFLPMLKISQEHGVLQQVTLNFVNNKTIIMLLPLYHPAAALYNGSMRDTLMHDFTQIRDIISSSKGIYDEKQLERINYS